MNERIKQLWDRAAESTAAYPSGQNNSWETQVNFMDKFAELIVRECADMAECFHRNQYDFTGNLELHEFIKEHFGVEE